MQNAREGFARVFGGSGTKRTRSDSSSTAGGSGAAGAARRSTAQASGPGPLNPQLRSFAQAASGAPGKRAAPAPPSFPRPQLRRGKAEIQHQDYLSMERPAPATPAPNTLYLDMRASDLSPEQALEAAFDVLGNNVLGFQLFAAQKVLALTFASAESHLHYCNKPMGQDGPILYPAPAKPADLLRLTLQGVPYWNKEGIKDQLPKLLAPYGEVVFLAPMVTARGWFSDQWHVTLARKEGMTDLPPTPLLSATSPSSSTSPGNASTAGTASRPRTTSLLVGSGNACGPGRPRLPGRSLPTTPPPTPKPTSRSNNLHGNHNRRTRNNHTSNTPSRRCG